MKKNYIHTTCTLVLLGAMAAGLWGCQKDDLAEQSAPKGALQLTVVDGGYTTGQALSYEGGTFRELPQTRATENGYKTVFTAGDQIGLYAVKGGSLTATNVCLTLTTDIGSGTLQWQPPTGVKLHTGADRYFAYYPYKSSPGSVTTAATTADAFFAGIISAWTPATDQSGTNYTKQDLMVGSGTLSSNKLTITLTHKMGLAVIKLPGSATDAKFNSFTPYTGVSGEYRYLLKPSTETPLKGSFIDGGELRGFAITAASTAEGQYKTYTVKGKPAIMSFGIDLTSYPDKSYILPFKTSGNTGSYTLVVDWGDGSTRTTIPSGTDLTTAAATSLLTHTYAEAKAYTITISSSQTDFSKEQIPGFKPGNYRTSSNNKLKLKSVDTPLLNTGETSFLSCFNGCTKLTGLIPENLFINNPQVTTFERCFSGCSGLTGIPSGLFDKNTEVKNFNRCFNSCSGLTGIPSGLFDKNKLVTDFSYCFYLCNGLTGSIPEGLFDNNPLVTNFQSCFNSCEKLTGLIPEGLFAQNKLATNFSSCFLDCTKLIMVSDIFCNEATEKGERFSSVAGKIDFSNCFHSVGSDSSVSSNAGTAPALWEYTYNTAGHTSNKCFFRIGTVINATSIPSAW